MKQAAEQQVVGDGANEHLHPTEVHAHDHYHVAHHHTNNPLGEFEHRASYHSHEHDHAALRHAHRGRSETDERKDHAATAHVHDHLTPVEVAR